MSLIYFPCVLEEYYVDVIVKDVIGRVSTISPVYENDKNGKPSKRRIVETEDKRFVRLK